MHAGGPSRRTDQGFTIAEVLVSVTILLIVVTSVIGAIQFAAASTRQSSQRDGATNAGNEVIELARNMPYDELGTVDGDPPGSIPPNQTIDGYTVETEVTYGRDTATGRATYKLVRVAVSWEEPFANQVMLETAVMGKSTLTNTGDILVQVLDADSFEPIEGVRVVIDPSSGANRTKYTEANGEAFYGYVPIGAVSFVAEASGYLIDVSPLDGAAVAADALSSYTLHAQRPSTGIVNVTGSDGLPIVGATVTLTGVTVPTAAVTLTTDASGRATFSNLFKGSHDVEVSASGRVSGTGVLQVTEGGQTVTLDMSLADPNQLTITVVRSSDSAPMSGATVSVQGPWPSGSNITGSPATSASSGLATFDLPGAGAYSITVSRSGYTTQSRWITVGSSGSYAETFSMAAPTSGDLLVNVTDSGGSPRQNAEVRVTGRDGIVYSASQYTGSDGTTLFSGLLPGRYYVTARRSGSTRWSGNVTVTIAVGATTSLTVVR